MSPIERASIWFFTAVICSIALSPQSMRSRPLWRALSPWPTAGNARSSSSPATMIRRLCSRPWPRSCRRSASTSLAPSRSHLPEGCSIWRPRPAGRPLLVFPSCGQRRRSTSWRGRTGGMGRTPIECGVSPRHTRRLSVSVSAMTGSACWSGTSWWVVPASEPARHAVSANCTSARRTRRRRRRCLRRSITWPLGTSTRRSRCRGPTCRPSTPVRCCNSTSANRVRRSG